MFRKLTIFLLIFFGVAVPTGAPPSILAATHRIYQRTITDHTLCSATAIGPHALLTASHCELPTEVLLVDDKDDAAIKSRIRDGYDHTIYIVDLTFPSVAKFRSAPLVPGDEVWIRGNPAGAPMFVRRGTFVGQAMMTYWYDLNGFYGDSGAAFIDSDGKIADVMSIRVERDDNSITLMGGFGLHFTEAQLAEAQK